ncbi:MAG: AraC family transcriptional regulator ligand-binding domain-containing protein, partial [Pseudomonadota bacterium]
MPRHYLDLLVGRDQAEALLAGARATDTFATAGDKLPSMLFLNLCLEQMRRTEDENCGVGPARVARGTFGLLIAAAAQGDTFAEGLQRFVAAAPMLRPDVSLRLTRSRQGLTLSFDYEGERDARRDLMIEIFVVTTQCGFRWLTGRRLRPSALRIAAAIAPMGPSLLLPLIAAKATRRGRGVTVTYAPDDAEAPLRAVKYQHWAAQELGEFTALLEEAAGDRAAP